MTKTKVILIIMALIFALAICLPLIFSGECEHRWGEYFVDTQPTLVRDGVEKRVCELCGESETRAIAKLSHTGDHDYSSWGSDEERHWLVCGVEGCGVKTNSTTHTWKSYEDCEKCQICSRPKD